MDENKQTSEQKSEQKNEDKKNSLSAKFNNIKGEFRKIIWPSRKDLTKQTITVIVTSLIIGVIIVAFDGIYGVGLEYFTKFLG